MMFCGATAAYGVLGFGRNPLLLSKVLIQLNGHGDRSRSRRLEKSPCESSTLVREVFCPGHGVHFTLLDLAGMNANVMLAQPMVTRTLMLTLTPIPIATQMSIPTMK